MKKTYGEQIREYRMARGWSISKLAAAAGVAHSSIARWESGETQPKKGSLKLIGKALGVEFDLDEYKSKRLYLAVTSDRFSLPLAVADTAAELAEICGVEEMTVFAGISRGKQLQYPSYIRIEIEEGEDEEQNDGSE